MFSSSSVGSFSVLCRFGVSFMTFRFSKLYYSDNPYTFNVYRHYHSAEQSDKKHLKDYIFIRMRRDKTVSLWLRQTCCHLAGFLECIGIASHRIENRSFSASTQCTFCRWRVVEMIGSVCDFHKTKTVEIFNPRILFTFSWCYVLGNNSICSEEELLICSLFGDGDDDDDDDIIDDSLATVGTDQWINRVSNRTKLLRICLSSARQTMIQSVKLL